MKHRLALMAIVAALLLVVLGSGLLDGSDGSDAKASDQNEAVSEEEARWLGLDKASAIRLAESEARLWRIAREGDETFAMDASLIEGRVTFEIDAGVVTGVEIEADGLSVDDEPTENQDRAEAVAAAVLRLLTVENTFAPGYRFEAVEIATMIGGDPADLLQGLELELLAQALAGESRVAFIDGANERIKELFDAGRVDMAVVSVDGIRLEGDRAEIDLSMWCGPLCGTALTYEVVAGDAGWVVTGPVGPIAVA